MDVRLPDGTVINNVPDDISKSDLTAKLARNGYDVSKLQETTQPRQEAPSGFVQGLKDPITAGAQLLTHGIEAIGGSGLVNAGNKLNNWLASKGVPIARIPEGGMDKLVSQQESEYQAQRKAAGESGIDWGRIGGNIANPANLVAAARLPQAATLAGRVGIGALSGAGFGAMQPVTEGNFWEEKGKQAGIGAATGGALPAVAGGIARMVKPNVRPEVQLMMKEGITPGPGQIMGGAFQKAEDKMTSWPIIGDAISNSRGKALDNFQLAAYRRALAPIGEKPSGIVGREGIAEIHSKLSDAYEALIPKMSFKADGEFATGMQNLDSLIAGLPAKEQDTFHAVMKRELFGRMTPQGLMSGESLKSAESALGQKIKQFGGSQDGYQQQLSDAFKEAQNLLRSNIERNSPQVAKELSSINKGWANYAILRDAASKVGAKDGMFTPAQLGSSVAAAAKVGKGAAGKARVSEGNALMQDLTDAGQNVLSSKVPDSGTVGRLAGGLAVGGGMGAISPTALAATGLASLAYLPGGKQTVAALLAKRPQGAATLAELIRNGGNIAAPGIIPAVQRGE